MAIRINLPNGGWMIESPSGIKYWFNSSGQYHREDGPAIECPDENYWYQNGEPHRLDGPASKILYCGIDVHGNEFLNKIESFYFFGKFFVERKRQ